MVKNGHFWIFRKNTKTPFFPTPNTRLCIKNYQILMNRLWKNAKNLHFWAFWAKRKILDSFWPKWVKREFFLKKHLENLFRGKNLYLGNLPRDLAPRACLKEIPVLPILAKNCPKLAILAQNAQKWRFFAFFHNPFIRIC